VSQQPEQRDTIYLSSAHRALLHGCCGVLFVTGALWLIARAWLVVAGEFGDSPHPLEHWSLQLHGAAAMIFLLTLGSLVRGHVRIGWKMQRSRPSGISLLIASAVLIASGWGLYYVGDETARLRIARAHEWIGLAGPLLVAFHIAGRRRALRRHKTTLATADARVA
jgi:hypothetical protein